MTRHDLESHPVQCPYCWQTFAVVVDCSVGHQQYVEDCEVCCRPILFDVRVDGQEISVAARHEDDTAGG